MEGLRDGGAAVLINGSPFTEGMRPTFTTHPPQVGGARRGAGPGHDVDLLISHPTDPAYFDKMPLSQHSTNNLCDKSDGDDGLPVPMEGCAASGRATMGAQRRKHQQTGGAAGDDGLVMTGDDGYFSVSDGEHDKARHGQGAAADCGRGQPLVHVLFQDLVSSGMGWCG